MEIYVNPCQKVLKQQMLKESHLLAGETPRARRWKQSTLCWASNGACLRYGDQSDNIRALLNAANVMRDGEPIETA